MPEEVRDIILCWSLALGVFVLWRWELWKWRRTKLRADYWFAVASMWMMFGFVTASGEAVGRLLGVIGPSSIIRWLLLITGGLVATVGWIIFVVRVPYFMLFREWHWFAQPIRASQGGEIEQREKTPGLPETDVPSAIARWKGIAIGILILGAGAGVCVYRGLPYGLIDLFSGGTLGMAIIIMALLYGS